MDMNTHWWIGLVSSFLASGVEVVEAVTIVLATGVTRGWRSTWLGAGVAGVALAIIVAILGPALQYVIPLEALRMLVGTLLLIYGLQWLRKAIMRYAGRQELHDEMEIYQREVAELNAEPRTNARKGVDWTAFVVSFKGVFLEGLEVVFIVITFGLSPAGLAPAVTGAALAALLITAIAAVVQRPLRQVPENTIKFVVGTMLASFGTFWAGEGIGLVWPGQDLTILGLIIFYSASAGVMIRLLRQRLPRPERAQSGKVVTES
jgi:uncharacterized membrane protein